MGRILVRTWGRIWGEWSLQNKKLKSLKSQIGNPKTLETHKWVPTYQRGYYFEQQQSLARKVPVVVGMFWLHKHIDLFFAINYSVQSKMCGDKY